MRISDWSSDVCSSDLAQEDIRESDRLIDRQPPIEHADQRLHHVHDDARPARRAKREYGLAVRPQNDGWRRSEEHTSELQSLMRISYAVFCLKKKNNTHPTPDSHIYRTYNYPTYIQENIKTMTEQ